MLFHPISEFIKNAHPNDSKNGCCTLNETVLDLCKKVAEAKFHRLFVIDEKQKVIGVVSLGDLIDYVFQSTTQYSTKWMIDCFLKRNKGKKK